MRPLSSASATQLGTRLFHILASVVPAGGWVGGRVGKESGKRVEAHLQGRPFGGSCVDLKRGLPFCPTPPPWGLQYEAGGGRGGSWVARRMVGSSLSQDSGEK